MAGERTITGQYNNLNYDAAMSALQKRDFTTFQKQVDKGTMGNNVHVDAWSEEVFIPGTPDYWTDEIDTDSSGTQMPTGEKVRVEGTPDRNETVKHRAKDIQEPTKTGIQNFIDTLKEKNPNVEDVQVIVLNELFKDLPTNLNEQDAKAFAETVQKTGRYLFKDDEAAFMQQAQRVGEAKNNPIAANGIKNVSEHSERVANLIQHVDVKQMTKLMNSEMAKTYALIDQIRWHIKNGSLTHDKNSGTLTPAPSGHQGIDQATKILADLNLNELIAKAEIYQKLKNFPGDRPSDAYFQAKANTFIELGMMDYVGDDYKIKDGVTMTPGESKYEIEIGALKTPVQDIFHQHDVLMSEKSGASAAHKGKRLFKDAVLGAKHMADDLKNKFSRSSDAGSSSSGPRGTTGEMLSAYKDSMSYYDQYNGKRASNFKDNPKYDPTTDTAARAKAPGK